MLEDVLTRAMKIDEYIILYIIIRSFDPIYHILLWITFVIEIIF